MPTFSITLLTASSSKKSAVATASSTGCCWSTTRRWGTTTNIEAKVAALDHLSNAALKEAAQSDMTLEAQQAFEQLLDLQTLQPLTEGEEARLEQLRTEYGRVLLRKARALALLAERSQALISE